MSGYRLARMGVTTLGTSHPERMDVSYEPTRAAGLTDDRLWRPATRHFRVPPRYRHTASGGGGWPID